MAQFNGLLDVSELNSTGTPAAKAVSTENSDSKKADSIFILQRAYADAKKRNDAADIKSITQELKRLGVEPDETVTAVPSDRNGLAPTANSPAVNASAPAVNAPTPGKVDPSELNNVKGDNNNTASTLRNVSNVAPLMGVIPGAVIGAVKPPSIYEQAFNDLFTQRYGLPSEVGQQFYAGMHPSNSPVASNVAQSVAENATQRPGNERYLLRDVSQKIGMPQPLLDRMTTATGQAGTTDEGAAENIRAENARNVQTLRDIGEPVESAEKVGDILLPQKTFRPRPVNSAVWSRQRLSPTPMTWLNPNQTPPAANPTGGLPTSTSPTTAQPGPAVPNMSQEEVQDRLMRAHHQAKNTSRLTGGALGAIFGGLGLADMADAAENMWNNGFSLDNILQTIGGGGAVAATRAPRYGLPIAGVANVMRNINNMHDQGPTKENVTGTLSGVGLAASPYLARSLPGLAIEAGLQAPAIGVGALNYLTAHPETADSYGQNAAAGTF